MVNHPLTPACYISHIRVVVIATPGATINGRQMLSYTKLTGRLKNLSRKTTRALVKTTDYPVTVELTAKHWLSDYTEINHSPVTPHRSLRPGHQVVTALKDHIATLQADLLEMKSIAGGHRARLERETERSNRLMAELFKASNETTAAREKAAYFAGKLSTAKQTPQLVAEGGGSYHPSPSAIQPEMEKRAA